MWKTVREHRAFWPPAAVVLLHVVALVVMPANPPLPMLVPLEAVTVVVLIATAGRGTAGFPGVVAALALALCLLGGVALVQSRGGEPWETAFLLIGVGIFVSYGLHRYERVALGLVGGEDQ
jgi:hypothetical protein